MNGGQITMIVLLALSLGISLAQHGKPKQGNESFWRSLIGCAINIGILWWGGFWN